MRRFMEEFDAEEMLDDETRPSQNDGEASWLMPQPPNMQQMLKQAQKMQQDMMAAQEQLKDEVVEASAGGGMVTVKVTGDLVVKAITIDPEAVDPEDVEMLQDMVLAAVNEALRLGPGAGRREAGRHRRRTSAASAALGPARSCDGTAVYAPPVQRLVTELAKLPGIGSRTAQRLAFHILRATDEDALALADAIREVKEQIGLCEVCFNLADGPRCRICPDERRDRERDLRRRGARPTSSRSSARTSSAAATTCSAARCRRSTASTPRT